MRRRLIWSAAAIAALLGVSAAGGGVYIQRQLQRSLPLLDGTVAVEGLGKEAVVHRDALGLPTIEASSRADAARALGFVHAQDRFFQMDLQRRQAAGELAALVGPRALPSDRRLRVHRFRHIARQALAHASPEYRAVLDAYSGGVNAGLAALGAPPIEYHALRQTPEPWRPEDSILTVFAMFVTLQGRQHAFESTVGVLHDVLPQEAFDFFTAIGSEWDAPVTGERFPRPPIPPPGVFDLREALRDGRPTHDGPAAGLATVGFAAPGRARSMPTLEEIGAENCASPVPCACGSCGPGIGSNNCAVAGTHTASGAALVANDMHLGLGLPNIWYRAVMVVQDERRRGPALRLAGLTLPGLPNLVTGSNGHVAWGFTNSGGDWSDLVIVEPDPRRPDRYLTPRGPEPFASVTEQIARGDGTSETLAIEWTIWGPVVGRDHRGRRLAQRWVAHDAALLGSDLTRPERARSLDELLSSVAGLGMPAQNVVAADRSGRIGWTIAGPIPRRAGLDGSIPTSWADGSRRWDGYLPAREFPRIVDPPGGRLWTANAPVVSGAMLKIIGEGGYADGIRARIIRDRLHAIDKATPGDMLAIQLDASALFLERWRTLLLSALSADAVRGHEARARFRDLAARTWTGAADPDSVAYLLVRTFRAAVSRRVYGALDEHVRRVDPSFSFDRANRAEGPLWDLVSARPLHLLHPRFASWDALLRDAVDEAIAELTSEGEDLGARTWGSYNIVRIAHPLGDALPLLGRWVNMPAVALAGDVFTPRAQSPRAGPSERMVVSPGREDEGILHMPGGQSGHPLSPHYRDQHDAWREGTPLPFLPGPPVAHLRLVPAPARAVSTHGAQGR